MTLRTGFLYGLALSLLIISSQLQARDWSEYTSTHFSIYTDEKPAKAKSVLEDFEKFRAAALHITGIESRPENDRMMIVMFANRRDYRQIEASTTTAGFYANTLAGPRMVVGPNSRLMDSSVILFHEYVHYLIGEHSDILYPKWYNEGFAELLASARINRDQVLIGSVHPLRRDWLRYERFVPVSQLLRPRQAAPESSYWARYYASTWAFTHYIQLGHLTGAPDHRPHTREYLMRVNRGEDTTEAFTQAFNMTPQQMDIAVRRHLSRQSLVGVNIAVGEYTGGATARRLSPNEQAYLLASLAMDLGKQEAAATYLQALPANQPRDARLRSLLALVADQDNTDQGYAHISAALEQAPNDPTVLTNAARFYWGRLIDSEIQDQQANYLDAVITYGQRATLHAPQDTRAHFYLWRAHAYKGDRTDALRSLIRVYRANPTNISLNMMLGSYLLDGDSPQSARLFLERALAWAHDENTVKRAQELLEQLDELQLVQVEG